MASVSRERLVRDRDYAARWLGSVDPDSMHAAFLRCAIERIDEELDTLDELLSIEFATDFEVRLGGDAR